MNMGEQETLITVALPEATRANSANSAVGALDNNVLENYDLRFILEIYQGNKCYRMESIGQETEATFPVRVVQGHEYDFVVWADFVAKGAVELAENDIFYNTNEGDCGLQNITILDNAAMTEARDAYYGVAHLDADKAVSTIGNITLTRPFAKVRVVTTDLSECIEKLGLQPQSATVTYTTDTYDKFDARNKNVWSVNSNDNSKSFNYTDSTPVYGEDNLFVDYILVPQGTQSTVKFDLNVTNVINRSFNTDIAVEANKITTIKGNILTNGSDIKVEINNDFVSETIYLEGDVTLTENLVIDRPMVVRKGATAVLDLNGFNITNNTKNDAYGEDEAIIVYGNLTIKDSSENGTGTVTANSMAVWARGKGNNAVVNIYGGTYYGCAEGLANSGRSVIYASGGNTINIYGGKFQALAEDTTSFKLMENGRGYAAVNVEDTNNNIISVYGGSFYKQDPADPRTENPARSFVAEGYVSVANGEWYDVVSKDSIAIETVDALKAAIASGVETINIKGGVVFEGVFEFTSINQNTTIICHNTENKATLKGRVAISDAAVTFENINFDYNDDTKISFNKVWPDSWKSNPKNHPAIVGVNANAHAATFKYCDFKFRNGYDESDWAPGAICHWGGKLTIDHCNFDGINYPIYAYTNFEMTNCTIKFSHGSQGVAVGMNYQAPGKLVFKNNKLIGINDSILTAGFYFLATQSWGTVYADIKNNECKYVAGNPSKITSVEYADGSDTLYM